MNDVYYCQPKVRTLRGKLRRGSKRALDEHLKSRGVRATIKLLDKNNGNILKTQRKKGRILLVEQLRMNGTPKLKKA